MIDCKTTPPIIIRRFPICDDYTLLSCVPVRGFYCSNVRISTTLLRSIHFREFMVNIVIRYVRFHIFLGFRPTILWIVLFLHFTP